MTLAVSSSEAPRRRVRMRRWWLCASCSLSPAGLAQSCTGRRRHTLILLSTLEVVGIDLVRSRKLNLITGLRESGGKAVTE